MILIDIIRGKFGRLDGGMMELALDPHVNKTGDIWHICIEVVLLLGCLKHYLPLVILVDIDSFPHLFHVN
jgi:hypothetical protein